MADSFEEIFVWLLKPWMAHQVRSAVAAKPLAVSTPSNHDSPNAPATARSVYVIAHPAARPLLRVPWSGALWFQLRGVIDCQFCLVANFCKLDLVANVGELLNG